MYYFKVGMVTLITIVVWSTIVVAGALFGWWRQPLAPTDDAPAFMRSAIKMLYPDKYVLEAVYRATVTQLETRRGPRGFCFFWRITS